MSTLMTSRCVRFCTAAAVALLLGACGIMAPHGNAGYADLDSPGFLDTDRVISLSLGPTVLHFAARHVEDDPETQALLRSLDGVRVRVYEIDGDAVRVGERLARMSRELLDDGWENVMAARQEGEQVHMLVRVVEGQIRGVTVLVSDDSEAVIVNLMGEIRPELFGEAMTALDIDAGGVDRVRVTATDQG